MSPKYIKYCVYVVLILSIYGLRLNYDINDLNNSKIKENSVEQKHVFEIRDDPEYKYFSTKAIGVDLNTNKRVLLVGNSDTSSKLSVFEVGDTFEASGYYDSLGEYDSYLYQQHIVGKFILERVTQVSKTKNYVERFSTFVRKTVTDGCANVSNQSQGICEGLLIGEKSHITKQTYDSYKQAQLTHLLVASGANIVFILTFLSPVLNRCKLQKKFTLMCLIALFYCIITRFEPSILRASVMVCLPAIARIRGYKLKEFKIFVYSILACLFIDPFLIIRVGFWLSSAATGGLYFLTPKIQKYVKSELVSSTLGATIAVQPVLWFAFGFTPPFKWPISVIAIAIAEPLSTFGFVGTCISSFFSPSNPIIKCISVFMDIGCRLLNLCADTGKFQFANHIGLFITVIMVFSKMIAYSSKKNSR